MNEEIVSVDAYAVQCTCTVYCTLYSVKVTMLTLYTVRVQCNVHCAKI